MKIKSNLKQTNKKHRTQKDENTSLLKEQEENVYF